MIEEISTIENLTEEINDDYVNDDLYNINSWGADYSFRELIAMYDDGDLEKPELQRKYVWGKPEASRFIDSVLLGLPIPSIFLAKTGENKMLIIDGYQRLMTVYDFMRGIWSGDDKPFKLSNIPEKINSRWRNKSFDELSDTEQRKIKTTTIHAIIFEQKSPVDDDTSLFQIFERINTGGRSLMPQEIRNCVYQGKINSLLFELNKNIDWRHLFGNELEDPRMRDLEFILRFLALNTNFIRSYPKSNISLKKYLNEFMGNKINNTEEFIQSFRNDFNTTISVVKNLFGENAFYNIQSTDLNTVRKRFYPTIFDAVMIATSIALKDGLDISVGNETRRLELLKDPNFRKFISEGTMQTDHINGRVNLALSYLYDIK
ncbi:DUF262 domain-containing protein [Pedobacter jejuensis]|uniref:DUF262 domain-containing protein n=1 Tax=Pedobacter jejuensis TaxID=1268550 RepID=A0A3N0BVE7_9SPHI|nr:DUF262 domain-containing protein [Pedobacter jejuensis]RNL52778.1 DUF262 domain-containing protein [Pedobacter jejuensis]